MKVWIVEEQICFYGEWETKQYKYFRSRKKAELAIREHLKKVYPEEIINTAFKQRVKNGSEFSILLPKTENLWASWYDVHAQELDEEFGD